MYMSSEWVRADKGGLDHDVKQRNDKKRRKENKGSDATRKDNPKKRGKRKEQANQVDIDKNNRMDSKTRDNTSRKGYEKEKDKDRTMMWTKEREQRILKVEKKLAGFAGKKGQMSNNKRKNRRTHRERAERKKVQKASLSANISQQIPPLRRPKKHHGAPWLRT